MEIHPPTKPIESVKDFLVHLSMITIGILIALGLEQALEAWHHHELGVEARENILNEIRDNKKELDGDRSLVKKDKQAMLQTLETVRQFEAHKKLDHAEMSVTINAPNLNSTSWTTAQSTGALQYMGYSEAKRFARAYDMQTGLQRVEADEFRTAAGALALVSFSPGGPPSLSDEQLRSLEREILNCIAQVSMWEQLAAQLGDEYDRVLKSK